MDHWEIVIVGAGPAGLSAAIYAARFMRSTLVLHDNASRAAKIPLARNVPGFLNGVAGPDLLRQMAVQAESYGATIRAAHVTDIAPVVDGFRLIGGSRHWQSRAVILATGIKDATIPLSAKMHQQAVDAGRLRWCPVCDGYEHAGQRIGVVGGDRSGAAEAMFLRTYSDKVTLLPRYRVELSAEERRDLEAAGVRTITGPARHFALADDAMHVTVEGQPGPLAFDVLYLALGCRPRHRLAMGLGVAVDDDGKISPDNVMNTGVPGLFCAGDIVAGLDQISVAAGHGAVAATSAHKWLREQDGATAAAVLDRDGAPELG